jgi:hypothetical protein
MMPIPRSRLEAGGCAGARTLPAVAAPARRRKWRREIDVYQVGEIYFVNDGNHRVSVAHQFGAKTIEAYVTEFLSPAALTVNADLDRLMCESVSDCGWGL